MLALNPSIFVFQVTWHLTQQINKFCFDAGPSEKAEEING